MARIALGISAAVGIVLCIIVFIGVVVSRSQLSRADEARLVARQQLEALEQQDEESRSVLEEVTRERDALARQQKTLAAEVAALEEELRAVQEEPVVSQEDQDVVAVDSSGLPVAFGKWTELEGVKNADWAEMAGAAMIINDLVADIMAQVAEGEPVNAELQDKVREENNKLVRYAASIMGKIPTHSPINGEFTHPITTANLLAAMLDRAEVPLTPEQRADISRFGEDYERSYDELQKTYTDDSGRLEKLIDELELKRDVAVDMDGVLTDGQRGAVIDPSIRHRLQLDVLSPSTMAIMLARPRTVGSVDQLRGDFVAKVNKDFKIDSASAERIADDWIRNLEPILKPHEKPDAPLHLDEVIIAGRAQAEAFRQLLDLAGLDDKARTAILSEMTWRVPRIKPKASGDKTNT